jgi:hypothetical protein
MKTRFNRESAKYVILDLRLAIDSVLFNTIQATNGNITKVDKRSYPNTVSK